MSKYLDTCLASYGPCVFCENNKADELDFEAYINHTGSVQCKDKDACDERKKEEEEEEECQKTK